MLNLLFTISGIVEKNLGRGKQLGYPTANIAVQANAPEGIFIGVTQHKDRKLSSLIFIGPSVTFNETDKKAEVYILDFDEDIYGETLTVDVYKKLRENIKFNSKEELITQMEQDEKDAREFFSRL